MEKNNKITVLDVFDMDGTLINSPLPDTGKDIWKEKTGNKWPHKGWWGRVESLDAKVFDITVIQPTVDAYELEMAKEDTMVIMMTGRMKKFSKIAKDILDNLNLRFDGHFFNTGGETGAVKMRDLEEILKKNPNITTIRMWDDRLPHVKRFEEWGEELIVKDIIESITVTHVVSENHGNDLTP